MMPPQNDTGGPMFTVEELVKRLRAAGHDVSDATLTTDQYGAAFVLDCAVRTLQEWRKENKGPRCYHTAGWRYELAGLIDYIKNNTRTSRYMRKNAQS